MQPEEPKINFHSTASSVNLTEAFFDQIRNLPLPTELASWRKDISDLSKALELGLSAQVRQFYLCGDSGLLAHIKNDVISSLGFTSAIEFKLPDKIITYHDGQISRLLQLRIDEFRKLDPGSYCVIVNGFERSVENYMKVSPDTAWRAGHDLNQSMCENNREIEELFNRGILLTFIILIERSGANDLVYEQSLKSAIRSEFRDGVVEASSCLKG